MQLLSAHDGLTVCSNTNSNIGEHPEMKLLLLQTPQKQVAGLLNIKCIRLDNSAQVRDILYVCEH